MKLIVGLGNPEKKYDKTRHNCGFLIIDNYANMNNLSFKSKFNGLYSEQLINNEKIILLKPQTYMNLSGNCVQKYVNFYNIDLKDVFIIYDDINFEVGEFKIKRGGSDGGHNGIKSVIQCLNSENISRIKIGIGKNKIPLEDYVLQKFNKEEYEQIEKISTIICNIINDIAVCDINKLMEKYNGKYER